MKAPYRIVGVVGLFLSSLPNASEAQQSMGEEMEALHRQVAQMQLAGRQLQKENQELKAEKILLQQENQTLKLERAELQKSQREAISLANTSQTNQQALTPGASREVAGRFAFIALYGTGYGDLAGIPKFSVSTETK